MGRVRQSRTDASSPKPGSAIWAASGSVSTRAQLLEPTGWRPADEDRTRNCDFSILHNTRQANQPNPVHVDYGDLHARQIVDWKSPSDQLNSYADVTAIHRNAGTTGDPFELLDGLYPDEALEDMAIHYWQRRPLERLTEAYG